MKLLAPSRPLLLAALLTAAPLCAHAQVSFTSAVELALRNSPRVRSAQAQVSHSHAELSETHDVYIPSVSAGADFGEAIGYSPYPPTLFSISAGSLVFNYAQRDYIRSARAGLSAAEFALADVRESVAEDAALAFVAVDHDQQQETILNQQLDYAHSLAQIARERRDAGYDSAEDLLKAQITAKNIELSLIHLHATTAVDRQHLGALLGLPVSGLRADGGFPDQDFPAISTLSTEGVQTAAVSAAFATAKAKQEQAFGDGRFLWRPQLNLIVQYNHYATFTDAFQQIKNLYKDSLSNDNQAYALQINIPLFDRARSDRARETAADAVRLYNDARNTQMQVFEGQARLRSSLEELQARTDLASLELQLAELQLTAVRTQLTSAPAGGPALTPKDEQNALINQSAKHLSVVDSTFQLRQSQISILRQTGRLEEWVRSLPGAAPGSTPNAPAPASTTTAPRR